MGLAKALGPWALDSFGCCVCGPPVGDRPCCHLQKLCSASHSVYSCQCALLAPRNHFSVQVILHVCIPPTPLPPPRLTHPDTQDPAARQTLVAELHRLKTQLFMRLVETGAMPLRPGVKRLVTEAIAAGAGGQCMWGVCVCIERVHPASASIIQSCDSPKLGTCACVRTAKNLYLNQINWKKFTWSACLRSLQHPSDLGWLTCCLAA